MAKLSFIGAGNIGGPLARRAQSAGHTVWVCDLDPSIRESFRRGGAVVTTCAKECAHADVTFIVVATGEQAIDVTLGAGGLVEGLDSGATGLVVVMSTILPRDLFTIRQGLREHNVSLIDAPVTGGSVLAEIGGLTILVGGSPQDVEVAQKYLDLMGREVIHCGDLGMGQTYKILNNLVGLTNLYISSESYSLGMACGISPERLASVLMKGTGATFWHEDWSRSLKQYKAQFTNTDSVRRLLSASAENWELALELAREKGIEIPFLEAMVGKAKSVDPKTILNGMVRWMPSAP